MGSRRREDHEIRFPVDLCFDLDLSLAAADSFSTQPGRCPAESLVASMLTVSERGVCSVCMEEYAEGKRTPCCHIYHAACISSWLAVDGSCPLCRCRIDAECARGRMDEEPVAPTC